MELNDMNKKALAIIDREYVEWIKDLKQRFLSLRLKATIEVNKAMLAFNWSVGKDIAQKQYLNTYGSGFYAHMSRDLRLELPDVKGFSVTNIKNMYYFYSLYSERIEKRQQTADDFEFEEICSIPWDHQCRIIAKCKGDADRALFFVRKVLQNGWGRETLVDFLKSDLYEREGKAVTNFAETLPRLQSDLAQQMTKDPYNFDFLTLTEGYKEKELEEALVKNVTRFLLELGTGFSYMGRQFQLSVGEQEFFPDLLFYNVRIHAYCVIELKTTSFKPAYLGQLSFYVSAIDKQFKQDGDNPTIGLLICRDKDSIVARYALEPYNQPLGISEYQLSNIIPKEFKSSLPSIEEIEDSLKLMDYEDGDYEQED